MNLTDVIFQIFNGTLEVFLVCYFFGIFAEQKKFNGKWPILISINIIFIISLCLQKNEYINFFILMILIFLISFLYKMKFYNNIFLSLAIMFLGSFSELLIAILSSTILSVPIPTLKTGYYLISGMLLSKLLAFLISAFIKFGKHSVPIKKLGILWIYILLMSATSITLILMISDYLYAISDNPFKQNLIIYSLFLLIAGNVLLFYVIDKMRDYFIAEQNLNMAKQMIDNQKKIYRELYDSQNEVRQIKHDLKNITIGILHQIETGKIDEAIVDLKKNCEILILDESKFISGNSIIDSLIQIKKVSANKKGIIFNVETELTSNININAIDFSVMLGNAIDNAIEATEKTKLHNKIIDISVITKNSNLLMIIKNPVDNKVDINYLSSTKDNKIMHGFGILQIKSLAERYKGELFLECSDEEFKTTIIINHNE